MSLHLSHTISKLYDKDAVHLDKEELLKKCDTIKVTVSKDEARNVEESTQEQAKSETWFHFRAGRITASKMKSVCRNLG